MARGRCLEYGLESGQRLPSNDCSATEPVHLKIVCVSTDYERSQNRAVPESSVLIYRAE